MARFRVDQHRRWRRAHTEGSPSVPTSTTRAARPPIVSAKGNDPEAAREALTRQVRALGPLGWPARAYDQVFGRWQWKGAPFFAMRFILVLTAVALFFGSALGDAPVSYKTGDFSPVTPANIIDTYVSEHSVHVIPVTVERTSEDDPTAAFTSDRGEIRVPSIGWGSDAVYGLKISLVRKDPQVAPILLVSEPGDSPHTVTPAADDGVSVSFKPLRLDEVGKWQLIIRTGEGVGRIEVHAAIARAPVETIQMPDLDLAKLGVGGGILILLVGAYTPGAALLRERRRLEHGEEEVGWPGGATRTTTPRPIPPQTGALAWQRPDPQARQRLVTGRSEGSILRRDGDPAFRDRR